MKCEILYVDCVDFIKRAVPKQGFLFFQVLEGMALVASWIVCGKFHYKNFLSFLDDKKIIYKVYFSHKYGEDMGVEPGLAVNLWLKEYILRALIKVFPSTGYKSAVKISHQVWKKQLSKKFQPTEINIFLMHGACLDAIKKCKALDKLVIGDAVNSHPDDLDERITQASFDLGLTPNLTVNGDRIKEELALCDYILVPSNSALESFLRAGFDRETIVLIPYGVPRLKYSTAKQIDGHRADTSHRAPPKRVVLILGQINIRKGHHFLLRALANLPVDHFLRTAIDLVFIGLADNLYLRELRRYKIAFSCRPATSHSNALDAIANADLLVLPSLEDGFGLVVAEALALGIPAAVSIYAGASELIVDGKNGTVFDPFDGVALCAALQQSLALARNSINSHPVRTWTDYADDLENFLVQAASRSKAT